jgi:hypothetical protein
MISVNNKYDFSSIKNATRISLVSVDNNYGLLFSLLNVKYTCGPT